MYRRRVLDQALLCRVAVEADDGRQSTADGGPGPAVLFEVAGVELDVRRCDGRRTDEGAPSTRPATGAGRGRRPPGYARQYRCPTGECSPASVWLKADRLHTLVPRESARWPKLYRRRAAVERGFGRLKNEWGLLPLRVPGLDRAAASGPDHPQAVGRGARQGPSRTARGLARLRLGHHRSDAPMARFCPPVHRWAGHHVSRRRRCSGERDVDGCLAEGQADRLDSWPRPVLPGSCGCGLVAPTLFRRSFR